MNKAMMTSTVRILVFGSFLAIALLGCDNPLNVYPRDSISPEDMGQNDIEQLLNGTYLSFQNAGGHRNVVVFDIMGGNLEPPSGSGAATRYEILRGEIDPRDGILTDMWNGYYAALYRANTLLDVLDNLEDTRRNQEIRGIAHYLRAYGYYGLVVRFGGVPILRENTRQQLPRNTEEQVWDFIQEELELAMELAPSYGANSDYYYVTSEAAQALMARVALTVGNNELAVQLAEDLIGSGHFQLASNYSGIFHSGTNSETIFAFRNLQTEGVPQGGQFTPTNFPSGGSYFFVPTQEAMDMFASSDTRRLAAFTFQGLFPMVNKYRGGLQGGDPVIVSRIAELYLISAEAQGPAGINRLNQLRSLRGLQPLPSITEEEDYLAAILQERNKELIWENFRFYDLVRTGRALAELEHFNSEHLLKLPIPVRELDLNPLLEQNPGY